MNTIGNTPQSVKPVSEKNESALATEASAQKPVQVEPVKNLHPFPGFNYLKLRAFPHDVLRGWMEEHGKVPQPLIINKVNQVLFGWAYRAVALELGWGKVDCVVDDDFVPDVSKQDPIPGLERVGEGLPNLPNGKKCHSGKSIEIRKFSILRVPTGKLTLHPFLAATPELAGDQKKNLRTDIERRGEVLVPLVANSCYQVIDGKHRLTFAKELKIQELPVIVRDDLEAMDVALNSAIARRQLTRSGVALFVYLLHPEVARTREKRKFQNLRRGPEKANIPTDTTFEELAEKYGFRPQYLGHLAKLESQLSPEDWEKAKADILDGKKNLSEDYAGAMGRLATLGKKRQDHTPVELFQKALDLTSKRQRNLWLTTDNGSREAKEKREHIRQGLRVFVKALPEDLQNVVYEVLKGTNTKKNS